jgi:hypothetical protein
VNVTVLRTGLRAAVGAGILSGAPSSAYCLAVGRDPLEATEAAGSMLRPAEQRRSHLLVAAVPVHSAVSLVWATLLAVVLPQRRTVLWGAFAGLGIAVFDLGVLARPFPRVRALPRGPQVADHIAFGAVAALCIKRSRRHSTQTPRPLSSDDDRRAGSQGSSERGKLAEGRSILLTRSITTGRGGKDR